MGETKSLNSHVLKRISMVSSEESIGELVRDRSASSGDQPVLSDSGALKSSSNPNLFNQHNAMLIKEVSLKNDISAVAKVGEMESDSEYSRS